MSTCLAQPAASAPCVQGNWRPQAHRYMMRVPRPYQPEDRYLVEALMAAGVAGRMREWVVPTVTGVRVFLAQFRPCSALFSLCWFFGRNAQCDARPDCWRPDTGSVAFRNPCC